MRVFLIAFTFLAAAPAHAVAPEAASKMVKTTVDQALEILRDPKLQGSVNRAQRWQELRTLSNTVFDWSTMAQRSLGIHWRSLDEAQRSRFVDVFRELIAANYLGQIDAFQGEETLSFVGNEETGKGQVWVKMELVTQSRQRVPLEFLVADGNRVHDVKIEGISITAHYRDSLNRVFVNGGFEVAMRKLEAKAAANRRMAEASVKREGEPTKPD